MKTFLYFLSYTLFPGVSIIWCERFSNIIYSLTVFLGCDTFG